MSDSLLSPAVGLACAACAAGLVAHSARKFAAEPEHDAKIPLAGVLGAFVFAGQMLNFAVPGTGSSGHIGGGLLLAALLGPYAAFLTIAAVLTIQCLFFQDGGILALGCNILNLGFWPCFLALPLYRRLCRNRGDAVLASPRTPLESGTATGLSLTPGVAECAGGGTAVPAAGRQPPADSATLRLKVTRAFGTLRGFQGEGGRLPLILAAVVLSLELGAFGVVAETVLSGRTELPFAKFAPLMLGIHLPIAVCEGVLTAGLLRFVARVKPGVLAGTPSAASADSGHRTRLLLVSFGLAALLMAGVCSWFASEKPDGLEWATGRVAGTEELERPASGWVARVQEWTRRLAVFPDYEFRKEPGGTPGESGRDAHAPVKATDVSKMNAGTSAAGVVGALATGLLVVCVCGVLWLLRRRSRCAAAGQGGGAS